MTLTTMEPKKVFELCKSNTSIRLIDVRTPGEFKSAHATGAENWPLDQLDPQAIMQRFSPTADKPLCVICQSGGRSKKACDKLVDAGVPVINVSGGTAAWISAGLPVERAKGGMISIERQTRIAAGAIACIGGILSILVHPLFGLIPAGVGAGLMFAGATDSCAMGMILLAMPWNRGAQGSASCKLQS